MSLTSHLVDTHSPIGQFFRHRFAQTTSVTRQINPQLRQISPLLPAAHPWPYSHIGMAIDYRIRYSFALTPSHNLVAWHGAWKLLRSVDRVKMNGYLQQRAGYTAGPIENDEDAPTVRSEYSLDVIYRFFCSLDALLERVQPAGRSLQAEEERELCRYCFLLGLLEEPFRSSRYKDGPLMVPAPKRTLEELLAIPLDPWIEDLCALSRCFYDHYAHLLSSPHVLNPTFAGSRLVGGADADMIVDGCLIDMKTTKQSSIEPNWLRQIAGYLLLDYRDRYRIQEVGLYLVRHGLLLRWPAEYYVQQLTGDSSISVATLRQEFLAFISRMRTRTEQTQHGEKGRT